MKTETEIEIDHEVIHDGIGEISDALDQWDAPTDIQADWQRLIDWLIDDGGLEPPDCDADADDEVSQ